MEVYVDDDSKLTLHGLQQHYVKLKDNEKNRKLFELLDALEFNQVICSSSRDLPYPLISAHIHAHIKWFSYLVTHLMSYYTGCRCFCAECNHVAGM